jgi:hypothetical protein
MYADRARHDFRSRENSRVASARGIAVVKNLDNTLEMFIPSATGDVYHNRQLTPRGEWSGWSDLGGNGIRSLVTAINADGSLRVFGIETMKTYGPTAKARLVWVGPAGLT